MLVVLVLVQCTAARLPARQLLGAHLRALLAASGCEAAPKHTPMFCCCVQEAEERQQQFAESFQQREEQATRHAEELVQLQEKLQTAAELAGAASQELEVTRLRADQAEAAEALARTEVAAANGKVCLRWTCGLAA